jgi:hypothetical protein
MDPILISDLPFERWLALIFDPPVANLENFLWGGWWFDPAAPNLDAYRAPATAIHYMTRLFEDSARLLAPYDDLRVGLGLYYLISNGASEHGLALLNESVPIKDREHCLRALPGLYAEVFAARLPAHTSRALDDPNALQLACYMWWDVFPLMGQPENRAQARLDRAALDVMAAALNLDSPPCHESGLHGLGHWFIAYSTEVTATIDRYLARNPALPPDLADYARAARSGCVQ